MSDLARRLGGVLRGAQNQTLGRRAVRAGLITEEELLGPISVDALLLTKGVSADRIQRLRDEVDREDYALFRPDRAMPREVQEVLAEPDRRIAEFIRISRLGQGGIGEVWKAWDSRLGRWVALKLPMATPDQEGAAERFSREALAAARLTHPNIVSIHRVAEENGRCFIVMQYVEGKSLRHATLDPRKALEALRDVARAVHYAHEQGVIHRDLKPGNIVIGADGRPFVLDFGLAHLQQAGRVQSREGLVAGTAAYMSPEQARGESGARERATDVYSLGATLYEIATGKPPFDGASFAETLEKVLHREPVSPRTVNPSLSPDVETVILKAMDKDPRRRYATAQEFADELDRCLRDVPVLARRSALSRRMRVGLRQNPWVGWVAAAVLLVVAGVFAWRRISEAAAVASAERERLREIHAAERERLREVRATTDMMRLSLDAMLTMRRAGANEGMKEFLGRIEGAHDALLAKGQMTDDVEVLLAQAYRAAMQNAKAQEVLGRVASHAGDYEKFVLAPKAFDAAALPAGSMKLTVKGWAAAQSGNFVAARQDYEKAVATEPTRVETWELLFDTYKPVPGASVKEQADLARRAEDVLTRALRSDRGYLPFWISRAHVREDLTDLLKDTGADPTLAFQGAEDDLSQAIRLAPSVAVYVARAEVRTQQAAHRASLGENPQKGFEEAQSDLDQAAKLDPKDPAILVGRTFALRSRADYKVGRNESPEKELAEIGALTAAANKEGPLPSEAWLNVALVWSDQALYRGSLGEDPSADFAKAEEAFDKFADPNPLERNEKRARMRVLHARLRPRQQSDAAMHDVDQALQDLSITSSLRIPYNDFGITRAMARRTKGTLMIACGQDPSEYFLGARSDLDQVLEANPVSAEASAERGHLELSWGRYRTKMTDRPGALDHYGRAVRAFEEAIRTNDSLATPLREWMREARRGMLGAY